MFVIMGSTGDYSDRCVFTKGYVTSEEKAKEVVDRLAQEDQFEQSIKDAKSALRLEFMPKWQAENPYPEEPDNPRPVFDQTRHKDKEYVKEHIERKAAWNKIHRDHHSGPVQAWYHAQNEAANAYVEANFTMSLCKTPKWTDTQYWYEEIEELI